MKKIVLLSFIFCFGVAFKTFAMQQDVSEEIQQEKEILQGFQNQEKIETDSEQEFKSFMDQEKLDKETQAILKNWTGEEISLEELKTKNHGELKKIGNSIRKKIKTVLINAELYPNEFASVGEQVLILKNMEKALNTDAKRGVQLEPDVLISYIFQAASATAQLSVVLKPVFLKSKNRFGSFCAYATFGTMAAFGFMLYLGNMLQWWNVNLDPKFILNFIGGGQADL
jgi:hypothetical protein